MMRTARCACGSLVAECAGEPARVMTCSCTECQRRTGSAFGIGAYYSKGQVQVRGAATQYQRSSDAGRGLVLHFCPTCGSTIYWSLEVFPDMYGVAVGAFADPAFPAPAFAVYTQTQHEWVQWPEGLQQFHQGSSGARK